MNNIYPMKEITIQEQNRISYIVASNIFKDKYFSFDGEYCYICYLYRGQFKKKLSVFNLFEEKNANDFLELIQNEKLYIKNESNEFLVFEENNIEKASRDISFKTAVLMFLYNKYK